MAAPVAVGTPVANGGGSTTVSFAAPTGVASGDHQGIVVAFATTLETINAAPSGWVRQGTLNMTGVGGDTTRLDFYLSTTATGAFSMGKSGSRLWRGCRFAYRGGPGFNTASLSIATSPSGATHSIPAQTTTVDNSIVFGGVVLDPGAQTTATVTQPAGWTELSDTTQASASGTAEALTVAVASLVKASPGAVSGVFTPSITDDAMVWSVILTGVADAAGVPTGRGLIGHL